MKKAFVLTAGLAFMATACTDATAPEAAEFDLPVAQAHGAPQGAHDYQLNIIGHPGEINDQTADDWGGNGHRIFVDLWGKSKINLVEGDYAVLDANGTDQDGATFQLPAPGLDAYIIGEPDGADVVSDYSVYIRPLGKPGGWATITTCADLLDSTFGGLLNGGEIKNLEGALGGYCSIEQVGNVLEGDLRAFRDTGKSSWSNVTAELTTIVFEVEVEVEDGVFETFYVRVPIFDDALENEYWEYDNHGLKLLQVRFFDCSTNVETGETTCPVHD